MTCDQCGSIKTYSGGCLGEWECNRCKHQIPTPKKKNGYTVNGVYFTKGEYDKLMLILGHKVAMCYGSQMGAWKKLTAKIVKAFIQENK